MTRSDHPSFELIREERVAEINATAREYRHCRTGARVLSVLCDDTNKVFGITFRTPPADSTGVAHILEHSVLCGSAKYPVKEPFVELLKGSLQTFLNAMTYPDKTCYPVASENVRDFYNLVDVYLDAVFHPRITPETLLQEGWHYEVEDVGSPLVYKGVVYNEMKGVYSSPEDVLDEYCQRSLFPDTTYGVDSGGDPRHIPDLTFEQFQRFHQTLYHPSNAYIYFYGDDDPDRRLEILDAYLARFEVRPVDSAVTDPAPFPEPRRLTYGYDPGEDPPEKARAMFSVNWLLPATTDIDANLALAVLAFSLIGTPASPLRKALLDSGLGEDLAGTGFANYLKRMYFGTGLRGIRDGDIPRAEAIIDRTLRQVAADGLDPDLLAASLNTLEFKMRESNTGGYPRGLAYMLGALTFWLYDADPLTPLRFEAPLARLKQRLADSEPIFQELVRRHFLENPHRTLVALQPEPGHSRRDQDAEAERLRQVREAMSAGDLEAACRQTLRLRELQETPDSPEDLARIPALGREDLAPAIKTTPQEILPVAGVPVYHHDLFTNGIVYCDVGFDLRRVPHDLLPLVPLFGRCLLEMDTTREDYVSLSNRIGKTTGGMDASPMVSSRVDNGEAAAWLFLRGKATAPRTPEMLAIFRDVLLETDFRGRDRFRQIVLEEKAGMEASIVPAGSRVADTRLRAGYCPAGAYNEQLKGVSQLFFLRQLAERIDADWPSVQADLERLRVALIRAPHAVMNITTDADARSALGGAVADFLGGLPAGAPAAVAGRGPVQPVTEGLAVPAKVNYVVKGLNLFAHGYRLHGSVAAITNLLRTGYLWDRIRVQGGAYGASCSLDARSGVFGFSSYRDPNLARTLAVYDAAAAFLQEAALDDKELTRNVVGAIGSLDAYQLPDARGFSALVRSLVGLTDPQRQTYRDELLHTTAPDVRAFADALATVRDRGTVVVVGSAEAIAGAAPALGPGLRQTRVL